MDRQSLHPRLLPSLALVAAAGLELVLSAPASGWGQTGHRVIGRIAERHLAAEAARALSELVAPESLAQVSTWSDDIRSDPAWDKADSWHYVNFPAGGTYERAAEPPRCAAMAAFEVRSDVVEAIRCHAQVLSQGEVPLEARRQSLRWLVHLVGDVHQPLHTGFADDRGGNEVRIWWMGETSNLHRLWDSQLIASEELSFSELADFLDHPTAAEIRAWQASGPLDWVLESRAVLDQVYELGDRDLGFQYKYRVMPILRQRLLQAGLRLAGMLNGIFAPAAGAADGGPGE